MRRSNKQSDGDQDLLDISEQEKIVNELRVAAIRQGSSARKIFSFFFIFLVLAFLCCWVHTQFYSWEAPHESELEGRLPYWIFQVFYLGTAVIFGTLAAAIKVSLLIVLTFLCSILSHRNQQTCQAGNIAWECSEVYFSS